MTPVAGFGTAYKIARDLVGQVRNWRNAPVLEVTGSRVISTADMDEPVRPSIYQIHVENRGRSTLHDCKARIFFYGTRNFDSETQEMDAEVTVDTRTCWARSNNPTAISLHAGDSEWLNVFRLVEDYTAGANFDPDEDRYLEFPTSEGWNERADIQFRHADLGAATTDPRMIRKAVHQTEWRDAYVKISSEEANLKYGVDFDDVNSRIGSSLLFTEDSFTDWNSKWTFKSEDGDS